MADPIVILKTQTIERCVKRARDEHAATKDFENDYTHQDAAILNVLRACEATIDMGNRLIRLKRLAPPSKTSEIFSILEEAGIIDEFLSARLKNMAGFRNLTIHDYMEASLSVIERAIVTGLDDLLEFRTKALQAS